MDFSQWLATCHKANGDLLSSATIDHYIGGVKAISKDMMNQQVIDKPLDVMSLSELDVAICNIFDDSFFIAKDSKGNYMYSNSLKKYRQYIFDNADFDSIIDNDVNQIKSDTTLSIIEKEQLIKARRGNGVFKDELFKKYNGRCIITLINLRQILIATHIKPWSVSTNKERLDTNNGLLLSGTYQMLFDKGLITFDYNGNIIVSNAITENNAQRLNIKNGNHYNIMPNTEMISFLKYHKEHIFVGRIGN